LLGALISSVLVGLGFFASFPSTTTYQLNSYGFGSGGTSGSTTSSYALEGITGEASGSPTSTTTYTANTGFIQTQQANVPKVTLSNPTSSSSSLNFVIDQQNNPSDALYALQIKAGDATCDFTTGTINYIKSDDTVGASLTTADYQNYATWGGGSGTNILGLSASTTYCVRAKAAQHLFSQTGGRFTESPYGPSSSAVSTAASGSATLSFCIYTGANCASNVTTVAYGAITPATVTNGPSDIHVEFATNAGGGGAVYIYSANGGLKSAHAGNYTVTSSTANLDSASEGFGAKVTATGQTSGGPMTGDSPYTSAGNNTDFGRCSRILSCL
jgi:hypothetical protein